MPPATDLSVERIRQIIDKAYTDYMTSLPPVERPTDEEMKEGDSLFAEAECD